MRERLVNLTLAAWLSLAPAAARGADTPAPQQTGQARSDDIDAEMLRDLEILNNPNYARDREIAKRLSILERLRMLDRMTRNRPAPDAAAIPAEPAKREVR